MQRRLTLYVAAGFFSILLSIWAALKTVVINPDAICYLYSAEAVKTGISAAAHLCPQAKWPFFAMLIYGLKEITHLSTLTSAYCLNGFFSLVSVITFIAIIQSLTENRRIVALSAVVILFAHEFNGLRVEIIRDHGFWAFYLLSLFFALKYVTRSHNKICYGMLWAISLMTATLFRIEGIIFLILFPFAIFADTQHVISSRIKHFFQLNSLTILGGIALTVWIMLHPEHSLGRLSEVQFQIMHGMNELTQTFQHTGYELATQVLSIYSARDAWWILTALLAVWYVISVISNISLVYAVLVVYAWYKKLAQLTYEKRLVIWAYIFINIVVTLIFLVDNLFLAKRYLIALSLVLMIWVPFALNDLINQWNKRKWPLILAGIAIVIYGVSSMVSFGHSKKYIRDGGDWLSLHAKPNQTIYSNDYQLLYYSNHFGSSIFSAKKQFENMNTIKNGKWRQYDYLALRVDTVYLKEKTSLLNEITLAPVVIFQNDRGDQVRIYAIHPGRNPQ